MTHSISQLIAYPIESFLVQRLASTFQGSIIFVVGKSPMDIMEPILL